MQQSGDLRRAVFLDRDGVINEAPTIKGLPYSPRSVQELKIIPGVKEAVALLIQERFEIVVVTNQPDIARGLLRQEVMYEIHHEISIRTGLEHFIFCAHDDNDDCACRKPRPGMLFQAARDLNLDLRRSFLVGDRWKDVESGQNAGCKCFFVDYGYREKSPALPFYRVTSLLEAAQIITGNNNAHFLA